MDIIYTDVNGKEIGIFSKSVQIDFEIGIVNASTQAKNDFQITFPIDSIPKEVQEGSLVYDLSSEVGGYVDGLGANTEQESAFAYGLTWRGMLAKKTIQPALGQDYFAVSGDANTVLSTLIDNEFDGLIIVKNELAHINVSGQFRYTNLLESIETLLKASNALLKIENIDDSNGFHVEVSAIPIQYLNDIIQLDNDYGVNLTAERRKNGINHVICLGQGELKDRQVIHLYKNKNGSISQSNTNIYTGLQENTYVYDYPSVESTADLIDGGTKIFDENPDTETISMSADIAANIGDYIGAKEQITNISMVTRITQLIYKGYCDDVSVGVNVGD